MKAKTINVQVVKNLGNYESIRIGGEWELNGEELNAAIAAAVAELENAYSAMKAPKTEPKTEPKAEQVPTGKISVCFNENTELLQKIVKRVKKTKITLAEIEQYYTFDEQARKTVELAIAMRG